jgi:hypothetical protein
LVSSIFCITLRTGIAFGFAAMESITIRVGLACENEKMGANKTAISVICLIKKMNLCCMIIYG